MANSIYEATGDGSTTDFTIPYTYLEANDVTAFIGGVSTPFTFTSDNIISFVTAPANGASVRILRNTDVDSLNVTYSDGGALTAEQLNDSNTQLLFGVQEAIDTANEAMILDNDGKFQAQKSSINRVIKNVADPVNAQDAATKNYLENTWLTPADKAQLNALNIPNLNTVANDVANVNTVATNIADVNTVATNITDVNTVAGIDADVTTVAGISSDVTAVVADATDIGTVSTNIANVNTVAGISADVTTVATNDANVTAVAGNATNINAVAGNSTNINAVSSNATNINAVAADATDIGTVATNIANVNAVGTNITNVNTVAGNTANINAVAADATDIGTVATNIANVNTAAGISANITTVAGIAADVTAAATNASDISAIAAEVAKVVTVANDLNEATSEIDVVANNIANVNLVGADIAAVINASNNLSDINAFGDTYFIDATAPASPTIGDLWFDTTSDTMKVYGASGWQNAGSSVNGTAQRVTYTATAGQTSFAATYDAGYVDVYLNGIKLIDGTDFTATNGTSIVLASGASLNDTVDIVAYGTFNIAIPDISGDATPQLGGDLATSGNDITFGDNDKAIFGAGSDLQIYHDGSDSYIAEGGSGTGSLKIKANNLLAYNNSNAPYFQGVTGGTFRIYYNGSTKLATTATGVDVTGGLNTTGNVGIGTASPNTNLDVFGGIRSTASGGYNQITTTSIGDAAFNNNGNNWLTVKNGVPADTMRIDSSGNVGIGTSSPTQELEVAGTIRSSLSAADYSFGATTSGGGGFFIEPDDYTLANPTWEIRTFANEPLAFQIGGTERLRIDSSGNVGIGTSPSELLHVKNASGDAAVRIQGNTRTFNIQQNSYGLRFVDVDAGSAERMRIDASGFALFGTTATNASDGGVVLQPAGNITVGNNAGGSGFEFHTFRRSGGQVGSITQSGTTSVSYNTSSDYRLKENVTADWDATTRLKQLNPVRFNFIADADTTVDGFLAHEVQDVVPEAIHGTKDGMRDEEYEVTPAVLDDDGNEVTPAVMGTRSVPHYQGIDQSKLVPLLVKTIQELEARIVALENI